MYGRRPYRLLLRSKKLIIRTDYGSILPKNNIKKSKKITLCAIFSALSVVIMYIGALFEVLDISMACIASMLVVITVMEIGGIYPWLLYGVTSTLSMLILPQKFAALIYLFVAGYYPMLKTIFERCEKRLITWLLKLLVFNAAISILICAAIFIFSLPDMTKGYIIAFFLLGNITFAVFDIALTMLIRLYLFKYRRLLRIDKILK